MHSNSLGQDEECEVSQQTLIEPYSLAYSIKRFNCYSHEFYESNIFDFRKDLGDDDFDEDEKAYANMLLSPSMLISPEVANDSFSLNAAATAPAGTLNVGSACPTIGNIIADDTNPNR